MEDSLTLTTLVVPAVPRCPAERVKRANDQVSGKSMVNWRRKRAGIEVGGAASNRQGRLFVNRLFVSALSEVQLRVAW